MSVDNLTSVFESNQCKLPYFLKKYGRPESDALEKYLGNSDFESLMKFAIDLRSEQNFIAASEVFGTAYIINRDSADALMARLSCLATANLPADEQEIETLKRLNENYHALFLAKRHHLANPGNSEIILQTLRNSFEGFHTGAEADWLFIEHAMKLHHSFSGVNSYLVSPIPRNLFMYWDTNPPSEIAENVSYHKDLKYFNVLFFNKESAGEFLASYYGFECRRMFFELSHPSEESDFFRFHAINTFGGYYLDLDEQIISVDHFKNSLSDASDSVFIVSRNPDGSMGPVHSAFFGSSANNPIITNAILNLYQNIHFFKDLSLWLKSGPGPITRAISRAYYNAYFNGIQLPHFHVFPYTVFGSFIRALDVSYRGDLRDWRVHEASR